jgi:hypothetical protein
MNNQEVRRLETFRRVRSFGVTHGGSFAAGTLARELFDTIAGIVDDLEGHAATQSSGRANARQGTAGKAAARAALLEDLSIFRRTARSMSVVMPGLDEKFRIPRNPTDQELLDTARAFLRDATPLKAEFLRREVPESLFEELGENITAFEAALSGQYAGKEESVTAGASIDTALERAADALRQLDPIVRNKLHNNPAALAAWESAKRTERAPRRSKPGTPTPPQTPQQ